MRGDLTIGKLAESAAVNIETIRYYQRLGLLDVPEKPSGGTADMVLRWQSAFASSGGHRLSGSRWKR